MRPRSITGPIILVLIGVIFLVNNVWRDMPVWRLVADYWPLILIALGIVGLVEVLFHAGRGVAPPPRPLAGGGFFWIAFALLMALTFRASRDGFHIGRIDAGGVSILGTDYDFDISRTSDSKGITRVVLDNIHGNVSLKGDPADGAVKVAGRKVIRAFNRSDADRANQQSEIRIERTGDLLVVRAEDPPGSRMLSITMDLDITVPHGVSVEARGRSGDLSIDDLAGSIDVTSGRGDVRLNGIGKDVRIESSRSDLVRAVGLKGTLDLQGRGRDLQFENIQGQVTVNGEYSGTLEFRGLAAPLHFQSQRSELRIEQVPGTVTLDLSDLKVTNAVGPMRFQTGSRDVEVTDVTNALELTVDRGDIQITQTKAPLPRMDIRSRNGDITLSVPDKAGFELDARTQQGEVENSFGAPLVVDSEGRGSSIKGHVGSGPGITLASDRGKLSVRKN